MEKDVIKSRRQTRKKDELNKFRIKVMAIAVGVIVIIFLIGLLIGKLISKPEQIIIEKDSTQEEYAKGFIIPIEQYGYSTPSIENADFTPQEKSLWEELVNSNEYFEYVLKEQQPLWYELYETLSVDEKQQAINNTYTFSQKYNLKSNYKSDEIANWNRVDDFLKTRFLENYQFAILWEALNDEETGLFKQKEIVDKFGFDDGLEVFILFQMGDYTYDQFSSVETEAMAEYLYKTMGKEKAEVLYSTMGIEVKIDDSGKITVVE